MDLSSLIKNKTIKKIFVAQRGSLGDTLLATPLLRAIKETYPDSKTIVLAAPAAKDILDGHPFVDELLLYDKGYPVFPIIKKIWRSDFALIIDLHYRSSLFAWLGAIPIRVGRGNKKKSFITHQLMFMPEDTHSIEQTLEIARVLGINTTDFQLTMAPIREEEKKNVEKLLINNGINPKNDRIVIVAPYALFDIKNWQAEKFQEVIYFLNKHGYKTIIVGGKEHRQDADWFSGTYNFVGDTTIRETTYLINLAKLVICGCTSVLHFTATTNTPSIAIYGPTSFAKWSPRHNCTVINKFLECSPCHGIRDNINTCVYDKKCLQLITAQEVIGEAAKILGL